jgi:transposase-like protein
VLEGLRGEVSVAELCRKEGINQNLYYRWSKEFLEAGKKRLAGDTAREATSDEVKELKAEARQLKETLAEVLIENRLLKKSFSGMGRTLHEVFRIRKIRDHRTGGKPESPAPARLQAILLRLRGVRKKQEMNDLVTIYFVTRIT